MKAERLGQWLDVGPKRRGLRGVFVGGGGTGRKLWAQFWSSVSFPTPHTNMMRSQDTPLPPHTNLVRSQDIPLLHFIQYDDIIGHPSSTSYQYGELTGHPSSTSYQYDEITGFPSPPSYQHDEIIRHHSSTFLPPHTYKRTPLWLEHRFPTWRHGTEHTEWKTSCSQWID